MADVEPFIGWLRDRGTPESQLAVYRHFVGVLGEHPSLSAALRAAEEAGTPPQQIANLRQTAARLVEFESLGAAPGAPAPTTSPAAAMRPAAATSGLDVEPIQRAPIRPGRTTDFVPPRQGCTCKKQYDVYVDNDFGALAGMLGGGIGIGTIILIRMIGLLGALALAFGLASMGGIVTIFSICYRCEGCRERVYDLDDNEKALLRKGRGLVVLVTAALMTGAVVCAYLWWRIMTARHRSF